MTTRRLFPNLLPQVVFSLLPYTVAPTNAYMPALEKVIPLINLGPTSGFFEAVFQPMGLLVTLKQDRLSLPVLAAPGSAEVLILMSVLVRLAQRMDKKHNARPERSGKPASPEPASSAVNLYQITGNFPRDLTAAT